MTITKNSKCSICGHQSYIKVVDEKTKIVYELCKFHYDEYIESAEKSSVNWILQQKVQQNNMKRLDDYNDNLSNNTPL